MASVHRKSGSGNWHAYFRAFDAKSGRWVLKSQSTHTTDRDKAEGIASEYERLAKLASGQGDSTITRQHVVDAINSILRLSGVQTHETAPPWGDYSKAWLSARKGETKPRTLEAYQNAVRRFGEWVGHDRAVDSITPADARRYVASLGTRERATMRALTLPVKRILEQARNDGTIPRNPFAGAVPRGHGSDNTRLTFTRDEITKLLESLDGEWKTLVLLGLCTGARIGDCAAMRWDHIKGGAIQWLPAKKSRGGKPVVLPLVEPLASHLQSLEHREGPLCPTLSTRPVSGKQGLSTRFGELLTAAKIDTGRTTTAGGRVFSAKSFHSLRHTLSTWLAESGVEESLRRRIVDHESAAVHAGYLHYGVDTLRSALAGALKSGS